MKRVSTIALLALVMVLCCGTALAARTIGESNETSGLTIDIRAEAEGSLSVDTNLVCAQGNEDLSDNPPLNPLGEGVNMMGYTEDTLAVSGSIIYARSLSLDTSNQVAPSDNLHVERIIDYSAEGDGTGYGRMVSEESVMVSSVSTAADTETACCPWGVTSDQVLPATNDIVISGSSMDVTEASVTSVSSATIVAASVDEPVQMSYYVSVDGSGQTGNDNAEGTATAYVEATLQEGNGNSTAMSSDTSMDTEISADGLIELAMSMSYTSS